MDGVHNRCGVKVAPNGINRGFALSHDDACCWRAEGCTVSNKLLITTKEILGFLTESIRNFWLSWIAIEKDDKLPTMNVEFISVASFILMSIVTFCVIKICLVVLSMQSRPVPLAVTIPVLPRMDDQRAFMVTRRVGSRPVPQENDEWLCWESKRAQFIWFSLSNSTDMPYPLFSN